MHRVDERPVHPFVFGIETNKVLVRKAIVCIHHIPSQVVPDEVFCVLIGILLFGEGIVLHLDQERTDRIIINHDLLLRGFIARAIGFFEP